MKGLDQYLIPYFISQVVAIIFLMVAWKNTRLARLLFALLFISASALNMRMGLINPDSYIDYARMAVPPYRDFINGWFSHYNHILIPFIAIGQFLIGVGMLLKEWWVRWPASEPLFFYSALLLLW